MKMKKIFKKKNFWCNKLKKKKKLKFQKIMKLNNHNLK